MTSTQDDINRLNAFLRGERAAVETYSQLIEKSKDEGLHAKLKAIRESHQGRVATLTERIASMGGTAAHDSGSWGNLAKFIEGGAGMLGDATAIAVLEKGEDMGHADYHNLLDLSRETRSFVNSRLVPEQLRTRDAVVQLRHQLSAQS